MSDGTKTVEVEVRCEWLHGIAERLRRDEDDEAARYAAAIVLESLARDIEVAIVTGERVVDLSAYGPASGEGEE